jgi:hypothetical protein
MSTDRDDRDDALREAFGALRREDAQGAGSFASLVARPPVSRRGPALILGRTLAAAALLASLAVGLAVRRAPPAPPATASITAWTAPTDFLLRTPGSEVLDTIPRIGPGRSLLALDSLTLATPPQTRSPSP